MTLTMLPICTWALFGMYAWWEIICETGFEPPDLAILPVTIALGPLALAINRWEDDDYD
ncbi:hypothetical protein [Bradyrhizobium lablabi]|uniref:hypothetical protein n=1 Tax=Bradyrhizobium lablabi TaxID=722472 RepID=UPI001BA7D256|nr:hypothetical protein [Bradyrhizobium lablabi]MBR0693599.1 hypothetical protein [Bradyrhizobium lablabi]